MQPKSTDQEIISLQLKKKKSHYDIFCLSNRMAVRVDRFQPSKTQMENIDLDGDHASGSRQSPPTLRISQQQHQHKQQENSTTFGQLYTQQLATMVDIRWKCISFDLFVVV